MTNNITIKTIRQRIHTTDTIGNTNAPHRKQNNKLQQQSQHNAHNYVKNTICIQKHIEHTQPYQIQQTSLYTMNKPQPHHN